MTVHMNEVQIGRVVLGLDIASGWIRDYTNAGFNTVSAQPYAFPAYDRYDGGTTEPDRLTDGDLMSPVLLNVKVSIRSFYGLQRVRSRLERALAHPILEEPLAGVRDLDKLASAVRILYEVLDDPETRPWGVGGTTLSKVLHRKRPSSVVLHDQWVRACYVGDDSPVPLVRGRSWADYMSSITLAIRADIESQPEAFSILRDAAGPSALTHVRLLDILAWKSKGSPPAHVPDEGDQAGTRGGDSPSDEVRQAG